MRAAFAFAVTSVAIGLLAGCGPDCRSSCTKLYGNSSTADGGDQCNITVTGREDDAGRNEVIAECEAVCNNAMSNAGERGTYDPNAKDPDGAVTIENEKQAAAWMDCIADSSCDTLKDGYCEPHY